MSDFSLGMRRRMPSVMPVVQAFRLHSLTRMVYDLGLKAWFLTGFAVLSSFWMVLRWRSRKADVLCTDDDPNLIKKYSSFESFTTKSGRVYPRIRVFYHEHAQAAQLPKGMPLLVFIHGLGGNMSQFSPLFTSMIDVASCLAVDLPGCGTSAHQPRDDAAYTQFALAELVAAAIAKYRDEQSKQPVILVGHSMGCTTSLLLASSTSPLANLLSDDIIGFVAICPRASPPTEHEIATIRNLKWMPAPLFDLVRLFDRRGGLNSRSVTRVVGKLADNETKKLQIKYNAQSRSAVFLQIIRATLEPLAEKSSLLNGWPGKEIWSGVKTPLFLVAGEADLVTPAAELDRIVAWLSEHKRMSTGSVTDRPSAAVRGSALQESVREPVPSTAGDAQVASKTILSGPRVANESTVETSAEDVTEGQHRSKHAVALKTAVFPAPAAHGLMYASTTVRALSGMIEGFFSSHVDNRLSRGWQLRHLTTSGKWDVKNLKKWQSIDRCSKPIGGVFRAMKTMREVDDVHCPQVFVKEFSASVLPDGVAVIVDLSHEAPVYDPKGLEKGGVVYHKLPTVSKEVPTADEVQRFITFIDELRKSPEISEASRDGVNPTIGVHCHYGFNRTGFFVVSYLVERLGYRLQDALDEFAEKKAPGIKHNYFIDELYARYAVSMKRRDTIIG